MQMSITTASRFKGTRLAIQLLVYRMQEKISSRTRKYIWTGVVILRANVYVPLVLSDSVKHAYLLHYDVILLN
jgi:hypothetical protein